MRLATKVEASELHLQSESWISNAPAKEILCESFCRYDHKMAVAEYLANQKGLTLYKEGVKLESRCVVCGTEISDDNQLCANC